MNSKKLSFIAYFVCLNSTLANRKTKIELILNNKLDIESNFLNKIYIKQYFNINLAKF
ncbi:hypothetical protein ACRAD_01400 [Acinetobacter radioresistens DSM 6976 = NBRC 102413 = CIP 103788]|nr:hypothetical protein ACRAD_01400 [Acinetobacter radioresistens DSM 6976 = NBRC 102413 = CIP 103788]